MSWINNEDYPPNKVYSTSSTEQKDIINDLEVVVDQVIRMRSEDNAEDSSTIMFYANATNGYIGVYMYDLNEMSEVGNSSYLIELPKLWDMSGEHEDGAALYDQITEDSVKTFGESQKGVDIKKDYSLYFTNELGDMFEV